MLIEVNGRGAGLARSCRVAPSLRDLELLQILTYQILGEIAVRRGQIGRRVER